MQLFLTSPLALCSGSCCISPDSLLFCWRGCGPPFPPALCMCSPRFDPDSPEPLPCPCLNPPACAGPCAATPSGSSGPLRPWVDPQPLHPGLGRPSLSPRHSFQTALNSPSGGNHSQCSQARHTQKETQTPIGVFTDTAHCQQPAR